VGVASWDQVANVNDPSKGFTIWKYGVHSYNIIINGTTGRVGPWPPLRVFVMFRYLRCGDISPTINLVLVILIRPPETYGSKTSRHLAAKQVKHEWET
jgi:hypothetical protein